MEKNFFGKSTLNKTDFKIKSYEILNFYLEKMQKTKKNAKI